MNEERLKAAAAGKKRYPGKMCRKGHTERYTSNGACADCCNERVKIFQRDARQRIRELMTAAKED